MARPKFQENRTIVRHYAFVLLFLFSFISCSSLPTPISTAEHFARLTQAEQRWQALQISDYQYRSKSYGRSDNPYNPFPKVFSKSQKEPNPAELPSVIIQIKNNSYHYSYYENDPEYEAHHFGGFSKLFKSIRETLEHMQTEPGMSLEVDYHPVYGFPTRMVSRQYQDDRLISISFSYIDEYQVLSK